MNILLGTDFLMTNEKEQLSNLKWLDQLIRPAIKNSVGKVNIFYLSDYTDKSNFSRSEFFKLSDITLLSDKTQFFYQFESISNNSLEYIQKKLQRCDLFIGYELSEQTRKVLESIKIKYIDIWLYPIRYMEDIMFGFHSNDEKINNQFVNFQVNNELFYIYANLLKIQNYRGFRRFKNQLIPTSALFVGQTLTDKAILHKNKMLSLLDYKEVFSDISKKYLKVYYSRHPFVKSGDEDILRFLKRFPNVEIIDSPTYHLLAANEIEFVFSISSSVVHEAHYFGKETLFLYKPIFETFKCKQKKYIPIMHDFLFKEFWDVVLLNFKPKMASQDYYLGKDILRDTLSFYWGYRDIDKVESLKQTVSYLFNRRK